MSPTATSRRRFLAVAGASALAGCTDLLQDGDGTPEPVPSPDPSSTTGEWESPTSVPTADVSRTVLVEHLEIAWDVSVASNGDVFVSERTGRVNRFTAGELEAVVAPDDAIDAGVATPGYEERPWWVEGGEGGTLGIAVHPDYPDAAYLFVYYTADALGGNVNRVSRFDLSADDPSASETILVDDVPASNIHNGGRISFGPDGKLWITTGDAGDGASAADPGSPAGKVLRTTVDGEPAPDNPDLGDDADPRVFTLGHRNPQGIVWLPDGTPVVSEHGQNAHDEINRLVAGDDYGWPNAPRTREAYEGNEDVHPPLANSGTATWAPTGSLFYTGGDVPSWRNRMLIGGLNSQRVLVATLTPPGEDLPPVGTGRRFDADWYDDAYTVTVHHALQDELGRVRHLEQGLDGELYAVTSNRDGRAVPPFPRERDDVLVRLEAG